MKKIENIQVKVTYWVELGGIQVPDDVYEALLGSESAELNPSDLSLSLEETRAMDWLASNVREIDACGWEYEIESID